TRGRPAVQQIVILGGAARDTSIGEVELLAYAAAAERLSEHPLAAAVAQAAADRAAPVPSAGGRDFEAIPGKGIVARVARVTAVRLAGKTDGTGETGETGGTDGTNGADNGGTAPNDALVEVVVGRPEFLTERGVAWPAEGEAAIARFEQAGQTPLAVALDGRPAGVIGVADAARDEAAAAIRALREAGLRKVVLLTGDRAGPAHTVAKAVGIAEEDVH